MGGVCQDFYHEKGGELGLARTLMNQKAMIRGWNFFRRVCKNNWLFF
jgi:hypothetical protein